MSSRKSILIAGLAAVAALACAGARGASWTGRAVLVGVGEYPWDSDPGRNNDEDARDLRVALLRDAGHWSASDITLLVESDATMTNVLNALNQMNAAAAPEDVCVFSFSGHGGPGGLGMYDGRVDKSDLENWLETSPCNHVCLIIHTCHAAACAPLGVSRDGFVVLATCDTDEVSYQTAWLDNGHFPFYLAEALGQAVTDTDGDGFASAEEIFAYAAPAVTDWKPEQHPQLFDRHVGPLNLVVTGTGTRKGPISPSGLPLGGGIEFGGISCAATRAPSAAQAGPLPGLLLAGAVLLLCLVRKRRSLVAALFLLAVLPAAGCSGLCAEARRAQDSFCPGGGHTSLLPAAGPAHSGAGLSVGRANAPGESTEETNVLPPLSPEAESEPSRKRKGYRLGFTAPVQEAGADYHLGPRGGFYTAKKAGGIEVELGIDVSLLVGRDVDVTAALMDLRFDVVVNVSRSGGTSEPYLYAGPRFFGSMAGTNWAINLVFEYDTGYGFGVGVKLPERGGDLRISWDVPTASGNIGGLLGVTWAVDF